MHFSIDLEEIKYEIENLGHIVTNIYNIRQNKTKLPLPMFFVDLKPAQTIRTYFKSNTYSSAKSHLNRPNKKGTLHNVPAVSDTGTERITVTSHQDA
jgi:hypothetical protein